MCRAAEVGDAEVVKVLLEAGVDVMVSRQGRGRCPSGAKDKGSVENENVKGTTVFEPNATLESEQNRNWT